MSLRSWLVALVVLWATGAQAAKPAHSRKTASASRASSSTSVAKQGKGEDAESAYRSARTAYYALKGDKQRKRLRHNWLNVASRFLDVAKRFPKSARAPDALFTAAELQNELSGISRVDEDLRVAMSAYAQLIESHPRHALSDDAALALARIYLDRLNRPEDARRVLKRGLSRLSKGDMRGRLQELLRSLGPEKSVPPAAVAAAPKPRPQATPAPEEDAPGKPSDPRRTLLDAIAALGIEPGTGDAGGDQGQPPASAPSSGSAPGDSGEGSGDDASDALPTATDMAEAADLAADDTSAPTVALNEPEAPAPIDDASAALPERSHAGAAVAEIAPKGIAKPIRRIIIDPGHGGHDSGAVGKRGTLEKDVALSISKRLAALLKADGYEVVLTRQDDRFIPLDGRAKFANAAKGDLFLSIHCNSAKSRKLRGIETYTLNVSSDRYAIRLAARENSATEEGLSDLQFILADLNTKANTEDSSRLASRVQESLVTQLRAKYPNVKDLGTKEALFYVLLGARMPAILVETSFVSNPEEEARLASGAYQQEVARAIARGIATFASGKRVAKID